MIGGTILETFVSPPPILINSSYTDDLRSIRLVFDRPTSQPASTDCYDFVRAAVDPAAEIPSVENTVYALGPAAQQHYTAFGISTAFGPAVCDWHSEEELVIQLSPASMIGIDALVGVVPHAISGNTPSLYGACGVSTPLVTDPPEPSIGISAPSVIGPCGNFLASAEVTNTGGRHKITWSISAADSSVDVSKLSRYTLLAEDILLIPSNKLEVGEYTITAAVETFFGTRNDLSFPFRKSGAPLPLLSVGQNEIKHRVDKPFLGKIDVSMPLCDALASGKSLALHDIFLLSCHVSQRRYLWEVHVFAVVP